MREHRLQTPLKELGTQRSKSISYQTKKPLKSTKKNLNSAFESISELSPTESVGSCAISNSESDDQNLLTRSATEDLLIPEACPSLDGVDLCLTLGSPPLPTYKDGCTGSNSPIRIPQSTDVKNGLVEAEL